MRPARVLIVDDSAVVRQVLCGLLDGAPGLQVMGAVADPLFAQQRMRHEWPDVIVLDVEMPRMDGLTFLRQLMRQRPTPVVVCSTRTQAGARVTVEALAAGAVAVLPKPAANVRQRLMEGGDGLVATVRAAAGARLAASPRLADPLAPPPAPARLAAAVARPVRRRGARKPGLVAIGASLGGTQALQTVLTALPPDCPPVLIVQHMPARVTHAFAERLDGLCRIAVREARDGEPALPGQALVAPGGRHLRLQRRGAGWAVEVLDGPRVNRHRPAVDVLFRSAAQQAGADAVGMLLTGMGADGARGLLEMRGAGAWTVAQDEASCVVYGMPRAAAELGAACAVLPLSAMAGVIADGQR